MYGFDGVKIPVIHLTRRSGVFRISQKGGNPPGTLLPPSLPPPLPSPPSSFPSPYPPSIPSPPFPVAPTP